MRAPAPLDLLRIKLASPNERTRMAALQHVAAHGVSARALAPRVAAMLADDSAAVQPYAVEAFLAIGRSAAEAVSVLLELRRKGAPEILMMLTAECLACIGPAARPALPKLMAAVDAETQDSDWLTALLEIAPDDPRVMTAVVGAALSVDFRIPDRPSHALRNHDGPIVELALSAAAQQIATGGTAERKAAANLLIFIAAKRPQGAAQLLRKLLRKTSGRELIAAVTAVGELPPPRPADLISAVIRIAAADNTHEGHQALSVLAGIGIDAAPAQGLFLDVIRRNAIAAPLSGEVDTGADRLCSAAKGIAAACPTVLAVPPLLAWLGRLEGARKASRNHLRWSLVGGG